jgi:hypothetical protein
MMAGVFWHGRLFLIGATCDDMDSGRRFDRNLRLPTFAADAALQRSPELRASFCNLIFYRPPATPKFQLYLAERRRATDALI